MVPRNASSQLRPLQRHRAPSASSAKPSYRSHSSSFEADDERSSSADDMGPEGPLRDDPSQYPEEDTRLTSTRELAGWYAYGFASEVFVICGIGSFIPITLEQLARENGVLLSDLKTPCTSSSLIPPGNILGGVNIFKDLGQCVVFVGGWQINTASFAMYAFSLSVLFQALLVISISCAADHGNRRKRLLLLFGFSGSVAMMLFLPVAPKAHLLGALLAIIANTCFGASFVLLNSFLPLLVRHHPKTQFGTRDPTPEPQEEIPPVVDASTALLPGTPEPTPVLPSAHDLTSIELQLSTQISSIGIGIGYCAGLLLQCLSTLIVFSMKGTTFSLRVVLFLIGVWWFLFTIPAALWLRPRPGPPLPAYDPKDPSATRGWIAYIIYAWVSLWRTIKLAGRLKDITLFLAAWFLLSDAIATVSGTAVLYAKTQLHMAPAELGLISVIATSAGIIGAFSWATISRFLNLRPHQTILVCICIFELIPIYGLLGYLPIVKRWGVIGLQQPWEMYPVGAVYGFLLGGFSSHCRSLFGELIPPGSEAAFYALYAITDKGSSVFGPAVVGAIDDRTGDIRPAFWFLAALVGLPGPLLYFVDVARGKREGAKLAEVIEGFRGADSEPSEDSPLLGSDHEERYEARTHRE